jgi:hypothetical protein
MSLGMSSPTRFKGRVLLTMIADEEALEAVANGGSVDLYV